MRIHDLDKTILVARSADESFHVARWGTVWFYVIEDHKTREIEQRCGGLYQTKSAYMVNALEKAESYDFLESEIVDTFPRWQSVTLTPSQIKAIEYVTMQATTPHHVREQLNTLLLKVI